MICLSPDNYSVFIDKIKEYQEIGLILEEAVNNAVEYCKENNILKKFLEKHSSEVFNMLLTEWNWDDALEVAREEGREDGIEEGMEKGRKEGMERGIEFTARNALSKGIPIQTVQEITGLDISVIETIRAKL